MANTLRSVLKLLVGDTKEAAPPGCSLTASITPKGPGLDSALQQVTATFGFSPADFSLTLLVHCADSGQSAQIVTGLSEIYAAKKTTSPLIMALEAKGIDASFEQKGEKVAITMKLRSTEAFAAICGMIEAMLPEVFSQSSKVTVSVALAKNLGESTESDLQALYALFEGCRLEITMELWRNLFHYLRSQIKDTMLSIDVSKMLTLASIYSRGSIELKLRGAHAIPAEIREKISSYSAVLTQLRSFIASEEEPAVTAFVRTMASYCEPRAEAVLNTGLGVITVEVNVPGLAKVFLKE